LVEVPVYPPTSEPDAGDTQTLGHVLARVPEIVVRLPRPLDIVPDGQKARAFQGHERAPIEVISRQVNRPKSRTTSWAPAARSASAGYVVATPTTGIPARRAAVIPTGASSNTTHAPGATWSRAAVLRYTSGSGLPRRTSCPVTFTSKCSVSSSASRIGPTRSGKADVARPQRTPDSARG